MPRKPKADEAKTPRRMLSMGEIIQVGDWLRVPGQIEGLATYAEIADKLNATGMLTTPATASNVEGVMRSMHLELWRPDAPIDYERAFRKLAEITLLLSERISLDPEDRIAVQNLTSELRKLLGETP